MIYTAKEGVDRRSKEKILTAQLIVVPLLMLGVTAYGLMGGSSNPASESVGSGLGVTLGTNTQDNTSLGGNDVGTTSSPASTPSSAASPGGGSSSAATQKPGAVKSSGGTTATRSPSGSTTTEGGRGGSTSGGGGGSSPSNTVACDNSMGTTTLLCTVCTNPTVLQIGQKAILASDGTCTAVDP